MNPPDGSSNRIESILERKNNGNPIELTLSSVNTDPTKPRHRWQVSSHADAHGKWETNYSASNMQHSLVYIPDADRINALTSDDVVLSTVSFTICNGNCAGDSGTIEANVLLRKTLTVRIFGSGAQKVELDWDSEFSGVVTKKAVNAHYVDREGTVDSFKISSIHNYDIQVTESKAGTADIVVDSGRASAELDYPSTHYAQNLVYGTWFFANDNNRFLFRPNSDAIDNLNPGESVTSTMSVSIFEGAGTTNIFNAPRTVSYTIQAPQTALSWNLGTTGTLIADSSTNYNDLRGTVTSKFLPATQIYNASITETKNNDSPVVVNTSSSSTELGSSNHYIGNLVYGTWIFATDGSEFLFRPNTDMINELEDDDTVTSELSVRVYNASTGVELLTDPVTITARIVGHADEIEQPIISISSPALSVVAGSPVSFTVQSNRNLDATELLDVNFSIENLEELIQWRIPNSVRLDSLNPERTFTLQTKKFYRPENAPKELTVTIESGEGYQPSNETESVSATVPIYKTGEPDDEDDSRVSVAQSAVNAILALQGANSPPEPGGSNTPSPIIEIHTVTEEIQEGEVAVFRLETSILSINQTAIQLSIEPNEKIAIANYQTVSLPAHQNSTNFSITTLNDDKAGEDSIVNVSIVNGISYEIGIKSHASVKISDSADRERVRLSQINTVNESILNNLIERTSIETLNLINNRVNYLASGGSGTKFQLGNNRIAKFMESSNEILFENKSLRSSALGESSFTMELFPEASVVSRAGLWGQGNFQTLNHRADELSPLWRGDMYTLTLGTDYKVSKNSLTGFTYTYADSQIDFNLDDGDSLQHRTEFYGVSPYWGWHSPSQDAQIHFISSIKQGQSLIEHQDHETVLYDNTLYYLGVGGNKKLWSIHHEALTNPIQINLDGQAWLAQLYSETKNKNLPITKLDSSLLNVAVEGNYQFNISESVIANPAVSIGYLGRKNSTLSSSGLFVEGNLEIKNTTGFVLSSTGQILQNEIIADYDWGLNTTLVYDKNQDRLGSQLKVGHLVGQIQNDGHDSLFAHENLTTNTSGSAQSNQNLFDSEISYGFELSNNIGILTPAYSIRLENNELNHMQIGSQLALGNSVEFELIGQQDFKTSHASAQEINFTGRIKW